MAGWLSNGVPNLNQSTGNETFNVDTELASGTSPQMGSIPLQQLANMVNYYSSTLSKTMAAGTTYVANLNVGFPATFTGVSIAVGSTGGTDLWEVGLFNNAGTLLANSVTTGTTAGTALTWQQIAFTATYTLLIPGTYWIGLQSNGTTAKFLALNSPTNPTFTGSRTGSAGTITFPTTVPTTYTANLGPMALLY